MSIKSIDEWIELLADRSKAGDIGEYFSREQCADILGFLNELRECREREYKADEERALEVERDDWEREG